MFQPQYRHPYPHEQYGQPAPAHWRQPPPQAWAQAKQTEQMMQMRQMQQMQQELDEWRMKEAARKEKVKKEKEEKAEEQKKKQEMKSSVMLAPGLLWRLHRKLSSYLDVRWSGDDDTKTQQSTCGENKFVDALVTWVENHEDGLQTMMDAEWDEHWFEDKATHLKSPSVSHVTSCFLGSLGPLSVEGTRPRQAVAAARRAQRGVGLHGAAGQVRQEGPRQGTECAIHGRAAE